MYQNVTTIRPVYLSEEEAMAILDLCLTSAVELDEVKERAVRKVTDLARDYLRGTMMAEKMEEGHTFATGPRAIESTAVECNRCVGPMHGEQGIIAESAAKQEALSPLTMMQRAARHMHNSLRCLGAAIVERRKFRHELA